MKAYLQDDRGSQLVYWINSRKGEAVIGWFATQRLFNEQIGGAAESSVDIHFTYPPDGDLHFSLKDQTSSKGDEVFETVFSDRVRRKVIIGGVYAVSGTQRGAVDSSRHALMGSSRPSPLNEYSKGPLTFAFPLAAIRSRTDGVAATPSINFLAWKHYRPKVTPSPSRALGNGMINVCAFPCRRGSPFLGLAHR